MPRIENQPTIYIHNRSKLLFFCMRFETILNAASILKILEKL